MQTQNILNLRVRQVLTLMFVVLFLSCKDEPAEIAANLFGDNLIDTEIYETAGTEITVSNYVNIAESTSPLSTFVLGDYKDSAYGHTKGAFMAQLGNISLAASDALDDAISEGYVYDSTLLVITCAKDQWIGDSYAKNKIILYELDNAVPYQNYTSSDYDPSGLFDEENPVGTLEFMYELTDVQIDSLLSDEQITAIDDDINLTAEEKEDGKRALAWTALGNTRRLEIPVDDVIGSNLYSAGEDVLTSDANLEELLKGLYVVSESIDDKGGNLCMYSTIALVVYGTKIVDDVLLKDSTSFYFASENKKLQHYQNDFSVTNIDISETEEEINNSNVDKIYLSGLGGTMAKVKISDDFINTWRDILTDSSNEDEPIVSVASAELSFYVDMADSTKNYDLWPKTLNIYIKNKQGEYIAPTFNITEGSEADAFSYFSSNASQTGGYLTSRDGYRYIFQLTSGFFEEFIAEDPTFPINGERNYNELYIGLPGTNYSFNRVTLHGMSITESTEDESIQPSNMTVRYVEIQ